MFPGLMGNIILPRWIIFLSSLIFELLTLSLRMSPDPAEEINFSHYQTMELQARKRRCLMKNSFHERGVLFFADAAGEQTPP